MFYIELTLIRCYIVYSCGVRELWRFVGQFFAGAYGLHTLVNPPVGVAQTMIVGNRLLDRTLGVLHLVKPLCCHLCHPLLKRLRLGRRNGLYQAEKLLCISLKCPFRNAII